MVIFVLIYSIGVAISLVGVFLYDYFYNYDRQIRYISAKEVVEDTLYCLLSWIAVAGLIFSLVVDFKLGWKYKGWDLKIKKVKEAMKHGLFIDISDF